MPWRTAGVFSGLVCSAPGAALLDVLLDVDRPSDLAVLVEGTPFFSVTVRGFKFEKTSGCVFKGHRAVYLGPGKAFVDEEGHQFPRNEAYEVCTDTVAKLSHPPYKGFFAVLEPGEERAGYACCAPGTDGTSCC